MFGFVMEDRTAKVYHAILTCSIVALTLSLTPPANGQTGGGSVPFSAKVVDLASKTARIVVPMNRSATVETTVPIARADVVARQVVEVQIVSPTRVLLTGQQYGSTSVILIGEDDEQYVFDVSVELDLQRLNESMHTVDPLSNAVAESVRGHILLTGTVSSAERAERITDLARLFLPTTIDGTPRTTVQNHMIVAGEQQVLLRCTVAEMGRSALRELGINGFLIGDNVKDVFLINQLGGINPINIGAAANQLVTQDIGFFTGENGIPLSTVPTLSLGFPRLQTQFFIKTMADNSLLSVLAEPNLVAISGETATFLAGGEFPIPVPQGNQQVTIEFREFGIRLNFTPVVKGNQIIRLRVAPEVSELDFTTAIQIEGFVVPGLTSRSSETTVELGSGQTIAIGGLLSEQSRGLASRVPGIGDVPVLGALFRSVRYERSLTELVILVTPEIVAPLDAHQRVRLPTDGQEDPDDFELYMLGLLEPADQPVVDGESGSEGMNPDAGPPALGSQPERVSIHGPWGLAGIAGTR